MKKFLLVVLYHVGAARFAAWWNRKRVVIICYHGVTQRDADCFAAQLDYLQGYYRVISLREYLAARDERRLLPQYSLILTFDDGPRNLATVVTPLLVERALSATVFLITDLIPDGDGSDPAWSWTPADDQEYLSWVEVQMLARSAGIEFGSHTCSHTPLTTLSPEEIEHELENSHSIIRTRTNNGIPPFAYPCGKYSDSIAKKVCAHGYTCALTTDDGSNDMHTDLFKLHRVAISSDENLAVVAARVSGLVRLLRRFAIMFR